MRPSLRGSALVQILIVWLAVCTQVFAQGPENVLVVVNENSLESQTIAQYYAEKRQIPAQNICRIRTSQDEKISRQVFDEEILKPVVHHLRTHALQDRILYIVTTRGLPLIVEGDGGPVGDLASVDSELALAYAQMIYGGYTFYGRQENSYFGIDSQPGRFRPFLRRDHEIYLVTRLTGASLAEAILLVDRGLSAAGKGTYYFDLPSQQQSAQEDWLAQTAAQLETMGRKVTLEKTAELLEEVPLALGYVGWGASDPRYPGRFPKVEWLGGAVATTFEPLSAQSFQDSSSTAAECVRQGVTGFGGFVADPTLDGYFRPHILFTAYAAGHNLAESFYLSLRYLSWRQVVIGDPLANPYGGQTASQRAGLAREFQFPTDPATGLPAHYSRRKETYLKHKRLTSKEAVQPLLKAEGLAARDELAAAETALEESLLRDPYLVESHALMAEVAEEQQNFAKAFDHYVRLADLSGPQRALYLKLSQLALKRLDDAPRAEPYARWLYRRYGRADIDIARLWAGLQLRLGNLEEAKLVCHRFVDQVQTPPFFALAVLGQIYFQEENWEVAREFLTRALKSSPAGLGAGAGQAGFQDPEALKELLEEIDSSKDTASVEVNEPVEEETPGQREIRPAAVLHRVPPAYPRYAQEAGIEGRVVLTLLIDEMGQLVQPKVVSGAGVLAKAAIEAVRKWQFQPRLVRGRPEASLLTVAIDFELKR